MGIVGIVAVCGLWFVFVVGALVLEVSSIPNCGIGIVGIFHGIGDSIPRPPIP